MMGPVSSASSSLIDELRSLLSLISDPGKLNVSLEQFALAKRLADEAMTATSVVSQEAAAKIRTQEEKQIFLDEKSSSIAIRESVVQSKELDISKRLSVLIDKEAALAKALEEFEFERAKLLADVAAERRSIDEYKKQVNGLEANVLKVKDDLDSRMAKLKALAG